jgi:hypothetical protein
MVAERAAITQKSSKKIRVAGKRKQLAKAK